MTMPTDPLDGGTPAAPGGIAGILKATPRVERRDPARSGYTGPERRHEKPATRRILGLPLALVLAVAAYVGLLAFCLILIFTY